MPIGNQIQYTDNVAQRIVSTTASAGQTTFTITDNYRVNAISVFKNGLRLTNGTDFTATDGSTVVLTSAASASDKITFVIFDDFNVAEVVTVGVSSNGTSIGDGKTLNFVGAGNTIEISGTTIDISLGITTENINSSGISTLATLGVTGVTTSQYLEVIGVATFMGDVTGTTVGIDSGGVNIGTAKTLNFIGTGNTFAMYGDTVDISISGSGGGGGLGTAINYDVETDTASPFSYIDYLETVTENIALNTDNAGQGETIILTTSPQLAVASGVAVTVGAGKTLVIDVLKLGDLP
tara:strand:- start:91 stop:972 length:882 start_codon:yes stop_codon:yes gene_type:complete